MRHGSIRAAQIYQHATTDRDRRIAAAVGMLVGESETGTESGDQTDEDDDGAPGTLVPVAQ